jgi:hypothetical protein
MEKCLFVSYPSGYKGWKFYNPSTQKYIICECAELDKRVFPGLAKYKLTSLVNLTPSNSVVAPTVNPLLNLGGDSDDDEPTLTSTSTPPPTFTPPVSPLIQAALRCTSCFSHHPGEWWKVKHPMEPLTQPPIIGSNDEDNTEPGTAEQANSVASAEPHTFKHAMQGPQSNYWREAASLEYNTLVENGTWEIVDLPQGEKAIGSGWVFQVKHNADGSIDCFKTWIVAKGYSQRPGLDYNESFAPTFHPATLCIIMAMSAFDGSIYIDGITLASKSPAAIDKYVQLLSQHFKCRDC